MTFELFLRSVHRSVGRYTAPSIDGTVWASAVKSDRSLVGFVFYWTGGCSVAFCAESAAPGVAAVILSVSELKTPTTLRIFF